MYDDFYGFSGRPFQLTPDPEFYFESNTHRKALSYLGYGLAQGEGFIVITGEVGAGKSTLAAHLMATVDRQRLTIARIVTSALDGEELIHVAAHAFGLDVAGHDKAAALATIEAFLQEEARAGRRCLLVVDEAQNLSFGALEELRMLSNFQLGAHPLLQLLLLGQPEFREHLRTSPDLEQLRQRVIANHHLTGMDAAEVGAYVEHRLRCVGWDGERPSFDRALFDDLSDASAGIPRRINQIVNRLLLMGEIENSAHLDREMLAAVLADMSADAPTAPEEPEAARVLAEMDVADGAPVQTVEAGRAAIEEALASRDEQISELQQAVIELAEMKGTANAADRPDDDEILEALGEAARRIASLEARVDEQEQMLRHTLTMLIEWFEGEDPQRAAA
ncbi:XrtA-associated ATPase [Novosphingobium sp. ZN18A2]|uniref:XrtA/PEP-CTERM system-associated ATPase n=1 Tax=Novosphingobium sp. ZN18A2 TaxID=3079861 RepID=UPI0030D30419